MHVAIVHNAVPPDAPPDERDVLVQADAVQAALVARGHRVVQFDATLDLGAVKERLLAERPNVVFNLVEALDGSDRLQTLFPAMLDVLGIPYTGVPTEGFWLASHKLLAKERLVQRGLPTPAWTVADNSPFLWTAAQGQFNRALRPPFIVKSVFEHASFGMDDASVVRTEERDANSQIAERNQRFGKEFFAEAFISGREFNISALAGSEGPQVLPPAEIDFSAFPEGKPRIVGYAAKWSEGTFEYDQTPRRFQHPPEDDELLDRLRHLTRQAWAAFGLRGYARVDFRVDALGHPWILEINGNPCLSPDAGFAAALNEAGIAFPDAIERILNDAVRGVSFGGP